MKTLIFTATYNGVSGQFGTGTATLVQGVGVPVIDPLTVNPAAISPTNSPGVQDTTSISTTVRGEGTSATWTVTIKNSANVTVRTFTGSGVINNNSFPIAVTWDGRNTGGTFVPDGTYTVTASFQDAAGNSGSTSATVTVDNTSPTAGSLSNPTPVIAPGTSSTVPTSTGLISTTVGDNNLAGWTVAVHSGGATGPVVRTFTGTTPDVNVIWDGRDNGNAIVPDGVYTLVLTATDTAGNTASSGSTSVVVLTQPPTVTLTSNSPSVYGDAITFTANVSEPFPSIANLLAGSTVRFFSGPTQITRRDRQRSVYVTANLNGRPSGDVSKDIQVGLDRISVPGGYKVTQGGDAQGQAEAFGQIFAALGLSVLLMYMLMVALFESLVYPLMTAGAASSNWSWPLRGKSRAILPTTGAPSGMPNSRRTAAGSAFAFRYQSSSIPL